MRSSHRRVVAEEGQEISWVQLCLLGGRFVIARGAAGLAVKKAVGAEAHVNDRLTEAAIFFALATAFRLLALGATNFGGASSGTHNANLARSAG